MQHKLLIFFMVWFIGPGFAVTNGHADEYLGKYCWRNVGGARVELVLTHLGDGHYLGSFLFRERSNPPLIALGNGALIGNRTLRFQFNSVNHFPSGAGALMGMMGIMDIEVLRPNLIGRVTFFSCNDGATGCTFRNDGTENTYTLTSCS